MPNEIEEIVTMVRLNLYNQDLFCGAQAILWELEKIWTCSRCYHYARSIGS